MPRAPFQVLVLPCRYDGERWLFAVFRRTDSDIWQGIAGGGEEHETPDQAASREAAEEAGIDVGTPLIPLDTTASIRADQFPTADWGDHVYVIPEHSYGVIVDHGQLTLSDEHREVAWLDADDAIARLTFDSNKTAIWELHTRLTGHARPGSEGRDPDRPASS